MQGVIEPEAVLLVALAGDDRPVSASCLAHLAEQAHAGDLLLIPSSPGKQKLLVFHESKGFSADPTAQERLAVIGGIVLVDDRVELSAGAVRELAEQLGAHPAASPLALAPRSNFADGDELHLGVPYRPGEDAVRRALLAAWRGGSVVGVSEASVLAGPVFAINRSALNVLGGLTHLLEGYDPGAWSQKLRNAGGSTGIAESAYAHHPGGPPLWPDPTSFGRPYISACLIVRDEEENLPRCITSLREVADEIVVYDTGSVDRTRELAAELGATVIEGYWDDDFGRARNDALEHCRGQWILWLDADEALTDVDAGALRSHLRQRLAAVEGYIVLIDNLRGTATANVLTHPAVRLFRRAYGHWEGRIHEQIVARAGSSDLTFAICELARITHWGYLQSALRKRDKGERNLRTAFADLVGGSELDPAMRLCSLGRSYLMAGRYAEGIELCREAAARAEREPTRRLALRGAIEGLLSTENWTEALKVVAELRAASVSLSLSDSLEGQARLGLGDFEGARDCFVRMPAGLDEDGFEYGPSFVAAPLAQALLELGEYAECADTLLRALENGGGLDAHLGLLVDATEHAGRDLKTLYEAIGDERVVEFIPQVLQLQGPTADRLLDAWYTAHPAQRAVLAAAAKIARRLDIPRQLIWSQRLRAAGLASACPLIASAADAGTAPRDRVLAAGAALVTFNDPRARHLLVGRLAEATAQFRSEIDPDLAQLHPAYAALTAAVPAASEEDPAIPRTTGRAVLLLDDEAGRIRSSALAATLRNAGHDVTLLHPQPTASVAALLEPLGVTVQGFPDAPTEQERRRALLHLVAFIAAQQPYEVVVLPAALAAISAELRAMLPVAQVVVDLDAANLEAGGVLDADLLFSSRAELPHAAQPVVELPASAGAVLQRAVPLGTRVRSGICIVANTRRLDEAGREQLLGWLGLVLGDLAQRESVVVIGDDPAGIIAAALPSSSYLGALGDPTPWMVASRVVLVAAPRDAEHFLAAAARCSTPALLWPADADEAEQLRAALEALCRHDDLFTAFAPVATAPPRAVVGDPLAVLPATWRRPEPSPSAVSTVRLVGDMTSAASLANVNRSLLGQLAKCAPDLQLTALSTVAGATTARPTGYRIADSAEQLPAPSVEIRHTWPPDFRPSHDGRLVLIQPWEFGGLPAEWIAPLRDVVDELWVPSTWERDCAVAAGVDPGRVQVIPNGVDCEQFTPLGERYPLRTTKSTKLLFVGGLIERKGVDALLEAYLTGFSAEDDVCLVIKPFGSNSVYRNSDLAPAVRRAAEGDGPEIELLEEELDPKELAALYRSCDVLVHPYRGEGFGLTIAEAMASGLAVIVPDGGAALDFCDEEVAWLVPAAKVPVNLGDLTPSQAGFWWLEPSREALMSALREAVRKPELVRARGRAGRDRIATEFTWRIAGERAVERLRALLAGSPSSALPSETPLREGVPS